MNKSSKPANPRAKLVAWDAARYIRENLARSLGIEPTGSQARKSKISFFEMTHNGLWFALIGNPEGGVAKSGAKQTRMLLQVEPPPINGIEPESALWRGHSIRGTPLERHFSCYATTTSAIKELLTWYNSVAPHGSKSSKAPIPNEKAGELAYTYSEIEPIISRICEELGQGRFATHDELVDALLSDRDGQSLIEKACSNGTFTSDRKAAASMLALFSKFSDRVAERLERTEISGQAAYRAKVDVIQSDIESLLSDATLKATERSQLVLARIGQGLFRRKVIQTWSIGERCAVTGCSVRQMLVASHIVPWSADASIRLDGTNGVLLCAHVDRLFDAKLVGFGDDGAIIFSDRLSEGDRDWLSSAGVTANSTLNMGKLGQSAKKDVLKRLAKHRESLL